jgi:enoyl-CoA hydratase/carnithine racemase
LIREGDIFFLVLNKKDNTFDLDLIDKVSKYLDVVAEAKGARVLVTVGTGQKYFSTGFPVSELFKYPFDLGINMLRMMKKLLVLPVPTMCVMNGHTMAGGFIFALCHDYRVMKSGKQITLSEINIELPVSGSYSSLVSELLPA